MTKKDFEAVASIIRQNLPILTDNEYDRGRRDAVDNVADDLADYFKSENPHFHRGRFLTSCGLI